MTADAALRTGRNLISAAEAAKLQLAANLRSGDV
jgi:hypothetical protein